MKSRRMMKVFSLVLIWMVLAVGLCACSTNRVHMKNSTVVAYWVEDQPLHPDKQAIPSPSNKPNYSIQTYLGWSDELPVVPPVLCRVTVQSVKNIEILQNPSNYAEVPDENDEGAWWYQSSIVKVRVDDVLLNPLDRQINAGEQITIYSSNNSICDKGRPVFKNGEEYYITMYPMDLLCPEVLDDHDYLYPFYREVAEFHCPASQECRWRIERDGVSDKVYTAEHLPFSNARLKTATQGGLVYDVYDLADFDAGMKEALIPIQKQWENADILNYWEVQQRMIEIFRARNAQESENKDDE